MRGDEIWKRFDRRTQPHFLELRRVAILLLRKLGDTAIARLRKDSPDNLDVKASKIDLPNGARVAVEWWQDMEPVEQRTLFDAGVAGVADAGGIDPFNLYDPKVTGFLKARKVQIVTVAEGHVGDIRATLAQGYEAGETVRELTQRVETWQDLAEYKAERIARTEVGSAANAGALEGYRQAGSEWKEWIATRDSRTRDGHAALDGKVIPIGDDFSDPVTGATGPAPGQMSKASSSVNCRCAIAPADAPE